MKITIHQSLCGENTRKAWDLLNTTMQDVTVAKNLAYKTDLQEQTGGVNWEPTIRGFQEGNYYLIMKTFEDNSSNVRAGRKFSHVLILNINDIVQVSDLTPIISFLPNKLDKESPIVPLNIDVPLEEKHQLAFTPTFSNRFNKTIYGYLNRVEFDNTLIWFGQEDFELIVVELWKRLSVEDRVIFNFGIIFNNDSIIINRINLLSTPKSIQSKFCRTNYMCISQDDTHIPSSLLEQIVIGDNNANKKVQQFKNQLDIQSLKRDDIKIVSIGIDTFENLDRIDDIKRINTLSHIIAQYSPHPDKGIIYKLKLVQKIGCLAINLSASDIRIIRNFKIDSYKNSKKLLSQALERWTQQHILSSKEFNSEKRAFLKEMKYNSTFWWDKAINDTFKLFFKKLDKDKIKQIFIWINNDSEVLFCIQPFFDISADVEELLVSNLPSDLNESIINKLKKYASERKLFKLLAKLLLLQYNFKEALFEQLKVDKEITSLDGILLIIKGQNSKSIINSTIVYKDERLINISIGLCNINSKLLNAIDFSNLEWQKIWLGAIQAGNKIDAGFIKPQEKIFSFFDSVISGNKVIDEILNIIGNTVYANILDYKNRNILWNKLSCPNKELYLKVTSSELLGTLSKNSMTVIPNDPVLSAYIMEYGINDFLYFNRNNIKVVIPIFEKFKQLPEYYLKDYINNYNGILKPVEAKLLGKLIKKREYYETANAVFDKSFTNKNWKHTLNECQNLLDFFKKGLSTIRGLISSVDITIDEWWDSTEDMIIELYPNGTSLTRIWKKAKGKESDLLMNATPNEVWHNAIQKLRKNSFKTITMNKLLKEIDKEYGDDNEKFKIIYNLRKKFTNNN